jgi:non-specific serine/threonine protein kinase
VDDLGQGLDGSERQHLERYAAACIPAARAATSRRPTTTHGLTERERDVAVLVSRGMTNRAIAEALVVGERTVETHVANMFAKLGFNTRAQLAAWAAEQQVKRGSRG